MNAEQEKQKRIESRGGARLAQLVKCATPDLGAVNSSPRSHCGDYLKIK